jgi:hypothetical protein
MARLKGLTNNIPGTPEDLVLRLEHLAHAAPADLTRDLVMPERVADHEVASRTSTADLMQCKQVKRQGSFYRVG